MSEAILKTIVGALSGDCLPADFSLPEEEEEALGLRFAAGAKDGIYFYHMAPEEPEQSVSDRLGEAIEAAASGQMEEAEALFYALTKERWAVALVDDLHQYMAEHAAALDAQKLWGTAVSFIAESSHAECVKIGLEILELYDIPDDVKTPIYTLGLCDEFTLFVAWCMQSWQDGNDRLFHLAQRVHGWGRIHAVELLKPETPEIRRWLLAEGWDNTVHPAYSALTCWEKSGAEAVLKGQPTEEEYHGLSGMLAGLLDEGPITGISEIEGAEELLLRFLALSRERKLSAKDKETLSAMQSWAESREEPILTVSTACRKILEQADNQQ